MGIEIIKEKEEELKEMVKKCEESIKILNKKVNDLMDDLAKHRYKPDAHEF